MQYAGKDITLLWDNELLNLYRHLKQQEEKRALAGQNEKFNIDRMENGKLIKKMDFAPANPAFIELQQAVKNEIDKRKIKV
jgi:hypothetical protein